MSVSLLCLISGLNIGGAEMMLYRLLSRIDHTRFATQVVSMIDPGPVSERIQSLGVPLRSLGMRRGRPNPLGILRLARILRHDRPDVIQTWMYHADLMGGLAARIAGRIPVAWGIRQSDLSREGNKWMTLQTVKVCARLSGWLPARIVCNSEASRQTHIVAGYAAEKMTVIPNGADLTVFQPDPGAREMVRQELQIPPGAPVIGLVGRFHPHKDHQNFVRAARLLHRHRPDAFFLLIGDGVTWDNAELVEWIDAAGIRSRCRLLGRQQDMPRLTAAFDIAISSSYGEGFANVIAEAMSCGVPCVVTDVGDSAQIVGASGLVVPPKDPEALALAARDLVHLSNECRVELGAMARRRIRECFDLPNIVMRYQHLYEELAGASLN